MNGKANWKQIIGWIAVLAIVFTFGSVNGYYQGTGTLPTLSMSDNSVYTPPITSVNLDTVESALVEDTTSELTYGEGWNCVDYAWAVMRSLQWEGINSAIIGLLFEDGTRHTLLLVATTDGWYIVEPQNDAIVKPSVGGFYNGKMIEGIDILTMAWVDIDEFKKAPDFGIGGENE